MTTRKKSVRKLYNAAIHMTFSILGLYLYVSTHNLLQETFGPGYLDNERLAINLLYATSSCSSWSAFMPSPVHPSFSMNISRASEMRKRTRSYYKRFTRIPRTKGGY